MEGTVPSGSSSLIEKIAQPSWRYRRTVIFATLLLDAITVATVLYGWLHGLNTDAGIAVISGAVFAQSSAIIGCYVFGAAWENVGAMRHLSMSSITSAVEDLRDGESTRRV